MKPVLLVAAAVLMTAGVAQAQTAPTAPAAQTDPAQASPDAAVAAPPSGEDWNAISRSGTKVFLVDVNSITAADGVTSVKLARVPLHPAAATDLSYQLAEMQYKCNAKESREVASTDYDETGAAGDRYETGEEFASFSSEGLDAYVANVACDGQRAQPPTFPSISAFMQTRGN